MPRPPGSKNISKGKAGGARKGAGRKSNTEKLRRAAEVQQKKKSQDEYRRGLREQAYRMERERLEHIQRQRNESIEILQQLSTRAQINNNHENDDGEAEEDEEFGESGDYDTKDEGEDATTKERRKRMRQSYKPPKDSVIEQELNKFQGKNNLQLALLQFSNQLLFFFRDL